MTKSKLVGHASALCAYLIFGFNIVSCKNLVAHEIVSPIGIFSLRALGATLCFWLVSAFLPREKVALRDIPRIFLASMLGLFLTQISFLMAMQMTTPVDASIITSLTPIFTMFFAAFFLKEPITLKKAGGVAISFAGVLFLIFNSTHESNGVEITKPLGVFLMMCNGMFFALYLGAFKPLVIKYSTITFMKYMFLFSALVSIPISGAELIKVDYTSLPLDFIVNLVFTVIMATFVAYFLIPIGQKRLRPTVVSMYSYLQPFVASILSIYLGFDLLNWQKIIAAILVFGGVYLVNISKAREN